MKCFSGLLRVLCIFHLSLFFLSPSLLYDSFSIAFSFPLIRHFVLSQINESNTYMRKVSFVARIFFLSKIDVTLLLFFVAFCFFFVVLRCLFTQFASRSIIIIIWFFQSISIWFSFQVFLFTFHLFFTVFFHFSIPFPRIFHSKIEKLFINKKLNTEATMYLINQPTIIIYYYYLLLTR